MLFNAFYNCFYIISNSGISENDGLRDICMLQVLTAEYFTLLGQNTTEENHEKLQPGQLLCKSRTDPETFKLRSRGCNQYVSESYVVL
jgi:hypothetical protein